MKLRMSNQVQKKYFVRDTRNKHVTQSTMYNEEEKKEIELELKMKAIAPVVQLKTQNSLSSLGKGGLKFKAVVPSEMSFKKPLQTEVRIKMPRQIISKFMQNSPDNRMLTHYNSRILDMLVVPEAQKSVQKRGQVEQRRGMETGIPYRSKRTQRKMNQGILEQPLLPNRSSKKLIRTPNHLEHVDCGTLNNISETESTIIQKTIKVQSIEGLSETTLKNNPNQKWFKENLMATDTQNRQEMFINDHDSEILSQSVQNMNTDNPL